MKEGWEAYEVGGLFVDELAGIVCGDIILLEEFSELSVDPTIVRFSVGSQNRVG
jgi:hypothetical protein